MPSDGVLMHLCKSWYYDEHAQPAFCLRQHHEKVQDITQMKFLPQSWSLATACIKLEAAKYTLHELTIKHCAH